MPLKKQDTKSGFTLTHDFSRGLPQRNILITVLTVYERNNNLVSL